MPLVAGGEIAAISSRRSITASSFVPAPQFRYIFHRGGGARSQQIRTGPEFARFTFRCYEEFLFGCLPGFVIICFGDVHSARTLHLWTSVLSSNQYFYSCESNVYFRRLIHSRTSIIPNYVTNFPWQIGSDFANRLLRLALNSDTPREFAFAVGNRPFFTLGDNQMLMYVST